MIMRLLALCLLSKAYAARRVQLHRAFVNPAVGVDQIAGDPQLQSNSTETEWSQTIWRSVLLALGLALAGRHLLSVAYAQSQLPSAEAVGAADHTPWSVLDDGRVMLTIYNVRIAMPTCARCLEYRFSKAGPNSSVSDRYEPTVREVIAHPERLRYIAANSERVTLRLGNNWDPEVNRGPFLGQVDPKSLPSTAYMYLTIYKHGRTAPCWTDPQPHYTCLPVHELDVSERRDDEVVAGMSVFRKASSHPVTMDYPIYLAPTGHPRDAIGLPVHFHRDRLGTCENSAFHDGGGFALRRDASLFFTFREERYAPSEWIDLHDRTTDAVRSLFLD